MGYQSGRVITVKDRPSAGHDRSARAVFLRALHRVLACIEDVGTRFAGKLRRMHYGYGEQEARSIGRQTSACEVAELMEEGIKVIPLSLPAVGKEILQ
ncbi:MAG: DUF1178 family protein [Polaromonas sp.]|nr:DUF1178 family protein [Polaromonas sp.]